MRRIVYGIKNLKTGKFIYVGQTGSPRMRWNCHRSKHRHLNVAFIELDRGNTPEEMKRKETRWIKLYRARRHPLLNQVLGARIPVKKSAERHVIMITMPASHIKKLKALAEKAYADDINHWVQMLVWRAIA